MEISDKEYERLKRLEKIVTHALAEKTGAFFICGEVQPKDEMGLPEKILVCPSIGSDGFAIYTKTSNYSSPSY